MHHASLFTMQMMELLMGGAWCLVVWRSTDPCREKCNNTNKSDAGIDVLSLSHMLFVNALLWKERERDFFRAGTRMHLNEPFIVCDCVQWPHYVHHRWHFPNYVHRIIAGGIFTSFFYDWRLASQSSENHYMSMLCLSAILYWICIV